ncbi:MAG: hypothetical protein SV377_05810, partial [Halobacteria archaeon]|nr:hypothetical protein [Halobacteria archaeon]
MWTGRTEKAETDGSDQKTEGSKLVFHPISSFSNMMLRNIPWNGIKRLIYNFRKTFYTVPKPEVECAVVDADFDELRRELGKENFMKEWGLSYNYKGEKLNMRRPEHVDDEFEWYQLHVRGFETPDGKVELQAHMELETVSYPGEHL